MHFGLIDNTKFTQPRLLCTHFGSYTPTPSLRMYLMEAPLFAMDQINLVLITPS